MRKIKRALFVYGGNITQNIKISVLKISNRFSLRKTTRKFKVMKHLFSSDGNGEEFVRFSLS